MFGYNSGLSNPGLLLRLQLGMASTWIFTIRNNRRSRVLIQKLWKSLNYKRKSISSARLRSLRIFPLKISEISYNQRKKSTMSRVNSWFVKEPSARNSTSLWAESCAFSMTQDRMIIGLMGYLIIYLRFVCLLWLCLDFQDSVQQEVISVKQHSK